MDRLEAYSILIENKDKPYFNVKIGVCSPQVEYVNLEEAIMEFDRCKKWRNPNLLEYVYIYVIDNLREEFSQALQNALDEADLGFYKGGKK